MPEEIHIESKHQSPAQSRRVGASSASTAVESNETIRRLCGICAVAMIGCFFLPWIALFDGGLSGFQLQQLPSNDAKLVWLVPCGGFLALLAVAAKQGVAPASQMAGGIPLLALIYFRLKMGEGFFQALQIGAYFTLLLGAALLVLPRFLKAQKP